ncbi:MAG: MGMT family protein [bacterium]|nr:MGMT family protein [bacterium]MDZ4296403.1 MGMT family protein [Patescibacteria group bacterium]
MKTPVQPPHLTPFEQKVYEALKKIPKGTVITYAELARRIGHPRAVRAVGNALHKNPFAPEVPCHRVVRTDGAVGGYARGGPEAKRKLLESEGVQFAGNRISNIESRMTEHRTDQRLPRQPLKDRNP